MVGFIKGSMGGGLPGVLAVADRASTMSCITHGRILFYLYEPEAGIRSYFGGWWCSL